MSQINLHVLKRSAALLAFGLWITMPPFAAAEVNCATAVPLDVPSQWRGVPDADGAQWIRSHSALTDHGSHQP